MTAPTMDQERGRGHPVNRMPGPRPRRAPDAGQAHLAAVRPAPPEWPARWLSRRSASANVSSPSLARSCS